MLGSLLTGVVYLRGADRTERGISNGCKTLQPQRRKGNSRVFIEVFLEWVSRFGKDKMHVLSLAGQTQPVHYED